MSQISNGAGVNPEPSKGNTALLMVAISLGIVAALANLYYLRMQEKRYQTDTFTVYRVTRSFEAGEKLKSINRDIEPLDLPNSLAKSYENALNRQALENQVGVPLRRPIREREIITWAVFTGETASDVLQPRDGMRAIAIPVNKDTAPNALTSNSYIDIISMVRAPGKEPMPKLVMERVRVLQVGNRTPGDDPDERRRLSSYNSVVLEVKPEEDLALKALRNFMDKYEFDIQVRNPGDTNQQIVAGGVNPEITTLIGTN